MKKKCNICKKNKPFSDYYNHSCSKDGKAYDCKSCAYTKKKQWNKDNPEKYKAQIRRRKDAPGWPYSYSRKNKIKQQKQSRIDLTDSYVKDLICGKGTIGEGIDKNTIPKELIEAYRVQLMLKRALRKTAIKPT